IEILGLRRRARAIFESAGFQAASRHHHAVRDADQFDVGEHLPGAQAAVVEHGLDAGIGQLAVQRFGRGGHGVVALGIDHAHRHAPRRHRFGPDDAVVVVVLLDRGGDDARDADAVAAHLQHARLALFVEHRAAHRLGVLAAELEHVADLDAAHDAQFAAVGGAIALDHVAHVGDGIGFGQVATPVDAGQVETRLVGADDEVGHRRDFAVGDHADRLPGRHRPQAPGLAAQVRADLGFGGQAVAGHALDLGQLDLVDLVVAAHQHEHELLAAFAIDADQRDRPGRARKLDAHQRGDVGAGLLRRRVDL